MTPKVRIVPLSKLILDDKNANTHNARGKAMLEKSLKNLGAGRSVLVDKDNRVIAGNATVEQARALGMKNIAVIESDGSTLVAVQRGDVSLDSKKGRQLAIADNRIAEVDLGWNADVLKSLDLDLAEFWKDSELGSIGIELDPLEAPEPKIDQAAALQKKWKTKRGQVWEIGPHRLMCGDSTEDVAALMGKKKAWMICTDPPYGVGYGVSSGPDSAKRFTAMGNDGDDGPALQIFLEKVFSAALPFLESGCSWYLWHAQMTQGFFAAAAAAAAAQVRIHRQIIWAKSHFILGHGDYHWQHELCFYGWREGEKHRWFGGRDKSTLWVIDNPRVHEHHPTEKPPEIFARAMDANTEEGDICYEPFSGSGSQLCAAHLKGRVCYAMEIEPKYVAVALERLSEMDLKPKLIK